MRSRKIAIALLAGVIILAGLVARRVAHPPQPGPLPVVPCRVTITDPASGLADVRLEFPTRTPCATGRHLFW